MANQDFGAGQQYDEDTTSEQWVQHGKQQMYEEKQGRQGETPNEPPKQPDIGRQARRQDQWDQEHGGLSQEPLMPESPLDEEEAWQEEEEWQEEDIAQFDKME